MGFMVSKEDKERQRKNKQIEEDMKQDQKDAQAILKLLLLGAGESGKSTVLKQMKILHDNGFSDEDYQRQRSVVYGNVVQSMYAILKAMEKLQIKLGNPEREVDSNMISEIMDNNNEKEPFSPELAKALERLWKDTGVQACYVRANEYQLNDSAQ